VSRSVYAALYAAISTVNGAGDGSTTFNLPDFRGRSPIGAGTAVGAAGATAHALGDRGGEEKHLLTVAELAVHRHRAFIAVGTQSGGFPHALSWFNPPAVEYEDTNTTGQSWIENTGGDQPHNNLQPFQTINWLIKT
jgi:microcystin-dependent protein